jgi:hypothetical protein
MKTMKWIGAGLLIFTITSHRVGQAQETAGSLSSITAAPVQSAGPDSIVQITAEMQGLQSVAYGDLPLYGTYWEVMPGGGMAPLPAPVFDPSLPIYAIKDNIFLVDASYGQLPVNHNQTAAISAASAATAAVQTEATAVANLIDQVQAASATSLAAGPQMSAMDSGLSGPPGFGDTSTNYTPDGITNGISVNYGTNLWIAETAVASGYISGIISNSEADVQMELQYTFNLTQPWQSTNWFVNGSESTNWTAWSEPAISSSNLFLRVRSWISTDGSGLPVWWEEQYFGTNVVNPYGDPMNDGWNNYEKFINGMNPNLYYPPPAPALTVSWNPYTDTASLNWSAIMNPAQSYTIMRYDLQDAQNFDTNVFNVSGSTTSMQDTSYVFAQLWSNDPQNMGVHSYYQIQANYASGNSAWSAPVWAQPSALADISLVPGPQGSSYVSVGSLPPGITTVQVIRKDPQAESFGDYSHDLTDNITVSSSTNGLYLLPSSITATPVDAYGNASYTWTASLLSSNGLSVADDDILTDGFANDSASQTQDWIVPPFLDGRQQLKQNLVFLLRAATKDIPFQFSDVNGVNGEASFTNQTQYVVSDLIRQNNSSYINDYYTAPDPMVPFVENYQFRNFIFTPLDAGTGHIETGVSGDYADFLAGTYPTPLVLTEPAEYNFSVSMVSGTTAPAVIPTSSTRFLCSYPMDSQNYAPGANGGVTTPYLGEIGVTASEDANSDLFYTMASNVKNYWGLPFLSTLIAYDNGSGGLATNVLSAGHQIENVDGYFYPETAQPVLSLIGYNFWNRNHCPESPGFSTASTNDLLIVPVGGSITVNGYEKLALQNGNPGVYAYLGQYFTNAFTIGSAGNVTSTNTGVLSPYGNFFATQPGPVALVTMPAIDPPYQSGTCSVYCISLNVDKNHDGVMDLSFNGPDVTSRANPMEFWLNTGDTYSSGPSDPYGHEHENPYAANWGVPYLTCVRDLENYARMWICGLPVLTNGNFQVTLSWGSVDYGAPAIALVNSHETNGGTLYLTDTNVGLSYGQYPLETLTYPRITTNSPLSLPSYLFTNSGNKYFMFEGAAAGKGELMLTISQNGSIIGQTGVWLDLHNISDFYEQVMATNVTSTTPPSSLTSTYKIIHKGIGMGNETPQTVVYVHGINRPPWGAQNEGETLFKRLYWSGYSGHVALFKWPCTYLPPNNWWPYTFNLSEFYAYKSASALKSYLTDLRGRSDLPGYAIDIFAHSQGNAVASEALSEGAPFDNYILTQGAVPAHSFDGSAPTSPVLVAADAQTPTPFAGILGGYNQCWTNFSGNIVNFFNANDFALETGSYGPIAANWVVNQQTEKPDAFAGGPSYIYYPTNQTSVAYYLFGSHYTVTDLEEIRSMVARSRTLAIGAQGPNSGQTRQGNISGSVDLAAQFNFGNTRPEHSAQYTRTIQAVWGYYDQILTSFQLQHVRR